VRKLYELAAQAVAGLAVRRLAATLVLSVAGAGALVTYEGSEPVVYRDPVGIPTVCVGHTATVTSADVGKNLAHLCEKLLRADTQAAQQAVRVTVKVRLTQAQYDALVSFAFNVGGAALHSSTLARKLNAGDCLGAAAEFPRWVLAKGQRLPGLVKRRADERKTFETGCSR
jgi:lysozyme